MQHQRSLQTPLRLSRFGYRSRASFPKTSRVSQGDRPCGLSGTWVSLACTRGPAPVFCAMVSDDGTIMARSLTDGVNSSLLGHLLPHLQPFEEGRVRREPAKVVGRSTDAECWRHCRYACGVSDHTV